MDFGMFVVSMIVCWLSAYYVGFLTGQVYKAEPLAHWLAARMGKK